MEIIDISRVAQEAPSRPGTPSVLIEQTDRIADGSSFNASMIHTASYAGTHVDAYSRFLDGSIVTIEQMPIEHFYGSCRVVSVPENSLIEKADLKEKIKGAERLVLHGGGASYLTVEAAHYIVAKGITTVVTDAISAAPIDDGDAVYRELFANGVCVVANVTLDGVEDGEYILSALPINYEGADAAPCRAILVKG